jgi:hypothetical protein
VPSFGRRWNILGLFTGEKAGASEVDKLSPVSARFLTLSGPNNLGMWINPES